MAEILGDDSPLGFRRFWEVHLTKNIKTLEMPKMTIKIYFQKYMKTLTITKIYTFLNVLQFWTCYFNQALYKNI